MLKILENEKKLEVKFEGEFDRITEKELEELVTEKLDGVETLIFDMEQVKEISSIGIRIFLFAQCIMNEQGCMELIHVSEKVEEYCKKHNFFY